MFYKMITKKRDEWFNGDCSVKSLVAYMEDTNQLRDAQIDAIKTYLFLKIACGNKPLYELFSEGTFNTLNLDELEISTTTRNALKSDPALAALYEYASITDDNGNQVSTKICDAIKTNASSINAKQFFKMAFYNVSYTDYLFSLPMGAGKTYLMAAFIYLDLYFAINEPDNPAYAHNFIILVPSGLKSSVIPSLRTIQNFDPSWVIPEPSASKLKQMLIFEVLDENKTAKKSNKTKNPNVQKIAIHQPLDTLMGFVAVTNAEKVILNRIELKGDQISLSEEDENDKEDMAANELRNIIGKIPHLSIFIDEVQHAAKEEKKLRAVVNKWATGNTVNSVIGFSGTPYLATKERISVTDNLVVATQEISNIVCYYPLINGIGNFLKKPTVYISDSNERAHIIENGVRTFLNDFKDKVYSDGTCAKLAIYCGKIKTLEEQVYPLVESIVAEYGLNPATVILKHHEGNTEYKAPADSEYEYSILDTALSTKKIILLVQIGKEGWDCRSLTGVILSQEGDCATNMVLQTSCRCLRQVQKGVVDNAMIYLNESNANTLNMQLQQQHRINIQQFQKGSDIHTVMVKRYDRTNYLKLPKVDFYQLKINYNTVTVERATTDNIKNKITHSADNAEINTITKTAEFSQELVTTEISVEDEERGTALANFNIWLNNIVKSSFGFINYSDLSPYMAELTAIFDKITYENNRVKYFSSLYDIEIINANIRKAFYDSRSFETTEELIPEDASLLNIANFKTEIPVTDTSTLCPDREMTEKIIADDNGKLKLNKATQKMLKMAEETGNTEIIELIKKQKTSHPMKDKSFHYLPYKTDQGFEKKFLEEVLTQECIKENGLEVYYNGDSHLTEFRIKCYERKNGKYNYIGLYTPDFLIIKRKDDKIYKVLIVETKGEVYSHSPAFIGRRSFMQSEFLQKNNQKFGYSRFDYLYLEDALTDSERIIATNAKINNFFTGE